MVQYMLAYDMFHDLADHIGQRDWSVVGSQMDVSLLVDWRDYRLIPVNWQYTSLQRLTTDCSDNWRQLLSKLLQYSTWYVVWTRSFVTPSWCICRFSMDGYG